MRKRKSSEPPEEENTPSPGDWRTGEAQVIRVVRISNIVWLCLGLVIGQSVRVNMFILKYQDSNHRMYLWGTMDHVIRGEVVRIQVRG